MFEEKQEICRACGDKWYSKWYKDGFCNKCQEDGTYDEYLYQLSISKLVNKIFTYLVIGLLATGLILFFT